MSRIFSDKNIKVGTFTIWVIISGGHEDKIKRDDEFISNLGTVDRFLKKSETWATNFRLL